MPLISACLRKITLSRLWAWPVLLALLWVAMGSPLPTLDFWWHLKVGEIIWTGRRIPSIDTFSYTAWGERFVYQNWLSEVAYYLTYLAGGFPLLIFLHALTIVLSFGVVLWSSWEASGSPRLAVVCTLVAEVLALRFVNARPQVFSMLLFAAFYLLLRRRRYRPESRLWLLVPLMVLWVNVHGAFVLGLALVALYTAMEWITALCARPKAMAKHQLVHMAVVLGLLILASLANPEGWRVYAYVRDVQADPVSQELVMEWQSPSVRNPADIPFFAVLFLGFWSFILSAKRDIPDVAVFSCFAAMALSSLRGIIWFALVLPPILAVSLKQLDASYIRWVPGWLLGRVGSRRTVTGRPVLNVALVVTLAQITLLLSPWVRSRLPSPKARAELVSPRIPREALEFMAEQGIRGRLFHPQEVGDYLIWRLYPDQRSFVDGRVHLYSEELSRDYLCILDACRWEELLRKYEVEWALLLQEERTERLSRAISSSEQWELWYEDDRAVLYHRVSGQGSPPPSPIGF